ncbi:MAG: hypothetical protein CVU35_06615 [Betaproteobacteria bacterium HGW-Betaproteobacteria-8]|nr:MAG: hypothetical protein CVU35_06615 [Betaproteobacteria bacterium HGW-Betaproteobacteria-8]
MILLLSIISAYQVIRGGKQTNMLYAIFNISAIIAIILHMTGHLERWGMEWILFVFAIGVFPAVIYL